MAKPLVSIIILNLNGQRYLKQCLDSVMSQSYDDKEVIFIDNGSSDDSVDYARKNYPDLKIIVNERNIGFAKANNQGLGLAGGEYIVTLNNDTVADKDWLDYLVRSAQADKSVGMCASKILSFYDQKEIDSVGVSICLDAMARGRGRLERDSGQYDKNTEILLPSACAALYRREMLDQIGFFDEDFFAYCEDEDLGLRGRLAGWRAVLAPQAIVYHHYSGTAGKYSRLKAFLVERNHARVAIKNFPLGLLIFFPLLTLYRFFLQALAAWLKKGASAEFMKNYSFFDSIKLVAGAYWEVFISLPIFIKKRQAVSRVKKLLNKEVYALIFKNRLSFKELIFKN